MQLGVPVHAFSASSSHHQPRHSKVQFWPMQGLMAGDPCMGTEKTGSAQELAHPPGAAFHCTDLHRQQ